jgi:hypothetical protein
MVSLISAAHPACQPALMMCQLTPLLGTTSPVVYLAALWWMWLVPTVAAPPAFGAMDVAGTLAALP